MFSCVLISEMPPFPKINLFSKTVAKLSFYIYEVNFNLKWELWKLREACGAIVQLILREILIKCYLKFFTSPASNKRIWGQFEKTTNTKIYNYKTSGHSFSILRHGLFYPKQL